MKQVIIIDKSLRKAICEMLEFPYNYNGPLTKKDLECLESLTIFNKDIKNLSGLEYAINLKSLNLQENNISDLSPIASLKNLSCLNLSQNYILDINPLTNLTNITYLNLSDNQLMDVNSLENLSNLIYLNVSKNQICDLSLLRNIQSLSKVIANEQNIKITKQNLGYSGDFTISLELLKDRYGNTPSIEHVSDSGIYNHNDNSVTWSNLTSSKVYNFRFEIKGEFSGDISVEIGISKNMVTNE